jgi:hypothetical protein
MSLLTSFHRLLLPSTICAALAACASADPPATAPARTAAPHGYEKTITDYLAFRLRGPRKNTRLSFGPPEPGSCALDGYANSMRGWVVPVLYETLSGEIGKEKIKITAKQYYFWFLGETIAGIAPRLDLCPGVGSAFADAPPPGQTAAGLTKATFESPADPEAAGADRAGALAPAAPSLAQSKVAPGRGKGSAAQRAKKQKKKSRPKALGASPPLPQ